MSDSAVHRPQAILLLGPTGAGKTPLGQILEERDLWGRRCRHFDFGANLREIVARNEPDELIGAEEIAFLREVLRSNALLEDGQFPLAAKMLHQFLRRSNVEADDWIVLNGLPRHAAQAQAMDWLVQVRLVVHLVCSLETALERIGGNSGGDRTDRVDDDSAAIQRKFKTFAERTAPLLEHYRTKGTRIEAIHVTRATRAEEIWGALVESPQAE